MMMSNESIGNRSILVIDDDSHILALLKETLEGDGFSVLLAADGIYGVQLVKEHKPDLVLLDITMPGPDGCQVIQSIREFSSIPIIMITGIHSTETIQQCLELGANDYVTKPFRPRELTARIQAKLKRVNN